MGVVIHILDRRLIRLVVCDSIQKVGTLRHLSKVTELDRRRVEELKTARELPAPAAVMVATPQELSFAEAPTFYAAAHPVLGWEEGRHSVTDANWDYLPVLGYAVRLPDYGGMFVLHELRDGFLHSIDPNGELSRRLLHEDKLVRLGQPVIAACHSVTPFIPDFVEADCVLEDGRRDRFLVRIENGIAPDPSWLVGRKPRETEIYAQGR